MTDTEKALDEIALLLGSLGGGGGESRKPTKTVMWRGASTAGALKNLSVPFDSYLTFVATDQSACYLTRNTRAASSFGNDWHAGGGIIAFASGSASATGFWIGREPFNAGDIISFDSDAGVGAACHVVLVFEHRQLTQQ